MNFRKHVQVTFEVKYDLHMLQKACYLSMQVCVEQHYGTRECKNGFRRGEGVRIALLEAAGKMLQDSFSLLSFTDQNHHLQK